MTKALHLFTRWHDGAATDAELVSGLAELPGVAEAMPAGDTRDQVLRLRERAESGESFDVRGGIDRFEVRERAVEGIDI